MTWSSHFPFLFIHRLKMKWERRAYLWSDLDLRIVSFYKFFRISSFVSRIKTNIKDNSMSYETLFDGFIHSVMFQKIISKFSTLNKNVETNGPVWRQEE